MAISIKILQRFFQLGSASGILLFIMAIVAMIWANSPLSYLHQQFISGWLFWINEGLMAIFFLVVGLELKREFYSGHLSAFSQVILPCVAAIGGMLLPALIYILINYHNALALKGWATPVATDIAFALGALSLFGRRVPVALKLFLLTLAIFDDIGAIIIIVLFYSSGLNYPLVLLAGLCCSLLFLLNYLRIYYLFPYLIVGVLLWVSLLHSGIHPTLAGILVSLSIPATGRSPRSGQSPLVRLEEGLHPWVAYFIMPLFALANAGFSLRGISWSTFTHGIVLGIALGLFLGKQIGVFGFSWLLIKTKLATLPGHTTWLALYGISLLCGIGFTMSLFLGTLSFANDSMYLSEVRLGVIIGSLISGISGVIILFAAFAPRRSSRH